MPIEAVAAALSSALIHASWNALLKSGRDRLSDTIFVALGWLVLALILITMTGLPPAAAWPYIVASGIVHLLYWMALIKGYDAGDLSHVYTLSRGSAPALVALGSAIAASEVPSWPDTIGIAMVCLGILCVGANPNAPLRASVWALTIGAGISVYSLVDALGARISGDTPRFLGWMFLTNVLTIGAYALYRRPLAFMNFRRTGEWRRGLVAGFVSAAGYGFVLWAQVRAPIAQVTALRETSVVFAALIAWLVLKEPLGLRRWAGALIVAAGAMVLGLS